MELEGEQKRAGRPKRDLSNMKFGKLVAVEAVDITKNKHALWKCKCECGRESFVSSDSLIRGSSKSCGKCSVNTFQINGTLCIGKTINGEEFIFDTEKLPLVSKYSWHMTKDGYVESTNGSKHIKLHRLIMNPSNQEFIDHINRNPSDNRKINLRVCNNSQNMFNTIKFSNNKSGYKNVYWNKQKSKWCVCIKHYGKSIHLGSYKDIIVAASAANYGAKLIADEFARKNLGVPEASEVIKKYVESKIKMILSNIKKAV